MHRKAGRGAAVGLLALACAMQPLPLAAQLENHRLSGEIRALGNSIGFDPSKRDLQGNRKARDGAGLMDLALTSEGSRVVWVADDDYDDVRELFSAPVDGTTLPFKLHDDLAPPECNEQDVVSFAITADDTQVVYLLGEDGKTGGAELWIAPLAPGGEAPRRLYPDEPAAEFGVAHFLLTPRDADGPQQIVFNARPPDGGPYQLFSMPVGGGRAVELSDAPVDLGGNNPIGIYKISPNGRWVAYTSAPYDGDPVPRRGVFSTEIGARHSARRLNTDAPLPGSSDGPEQLLITADSSHVVYRGTELNLEGGGGYEVISVPIRAMVPEPIRLGRAGILLSEGAGSVVPAAQGRHLAFPWSDGALYWANADDRAAIDCNIPLDVNSESGLTWHPDGASLFFLGFRDLTYKALWSCGADGSPTEIFTPPVDGNIDSFRVHPRGDWISFCADLTPSGAWELYSMPVGGGHPQRIHRPRTGARDFRIDSNGGAEFRLTPTGDHVVFHGEAVADGTIQLYSAPARPLPGEGSETRLTSALPANAEVSVGLGHTLVTPHGQRVVFTTDRWPDGRVEPFASGGVSELFSVDIDGSDLRLLNRGYAPVGDVEQFWPSPDSAWVVYHADHDFDGRLDLYAVPSNRNHTPTRISDIASERDNEDSQDDVVFVDGGAAVLFRGPSAGSTAMGLFRYDFDLRERVLLSRSADEIDSGSEVHAFRHLPPTAERPERTVYLADHRRTGTAELYLVSTDALQGPARIGEELANFASIDEAFEITPDGSAVVFTGDLNAEGKRELFMLDFTTGSLVNLSGFDNPDSDVVEGSIRFADGGRAVVFLASPDGSSDNELYRASLVDFQSRNVSGTGDGSVEPDFQITAGGTRAVLRADADRGRVIELYSVDLLTPAAPLEKLHAPLPNTGDALEAFVLSPDRRLVAFLVRPNSTDDPELVLAPVDASSPAQRVWPLEAQNDHLVGRDYAFSPDGAWIVFRSNLRDPEVYDLYKAPVAGGTPERIAEGGSEGDGIISFAISPDSYRVSYRLSRRSNGPAHPLSSKRPIELYSLPLDRGGEATRMDLAGGPYTDVGAPLDYLPDGSQLLFTDDRDKDETQELRNAFEPLRITPIPDQVVAVNGRLELLFSVFDFETRPEAIDVIATTSSDRDLIPLGNISIELVEDGGGNGRRLTVTPARDLTGGPVAITLTAMGNGETVTETFRILVGEDDYRLWLERYFGISELDDPELRELRWGFGADPDGDGIPNGAEWGMGLHPLLSDRGSNVFSPTIAGDLITLRHRRISPAPLTLQTRYELSSNLSVWTPSEPVDLPVVVADNGDHEIVEQQFRRPSPPPEGLFLRAVYLRTTEP